MNYCLSNRSSELVKRSSMANKNKTKTNKKIRISEDIKVHPIQDHFKGERHVGDLRLRISQAKQSLLQIGSDGVATTHQMRRPSYKLKSIDRAGRSSNEQQKLQEIQQRYAKDARVRAIQLHFNNITLLAAALPVDPRFEPHHAERVKTSALLTSALDNDALVRSWICDTGAGHSCIGRRHLTVSEKKKVYQTDTKWFTTAAGIQSTSHAVDCYVPYLGIRRCYVMEDCPPCAFRDRGC